MRADRITSQQSSHKSEQDFTLPLVGGYPIVPPMTSANRIELRNELLSMGQRLAVGKDLAAAFELAGEPQSCREAVFVLDDTLGIPQQFVTLTKGLFDALGNAILKQATINCDPVFSVPFEQRPEHLTAFSAAALNRYNQLYFALPEAHSTTPSLFNRNTLIADALAKLLSKNVPQAGPVNAKEISVGIRWEERWRRTLNAIGPDRPVQLTVSDFLQPETFGIGESLSDNLKINAVAENILEPMEKLPEGERLHALVATYGFDSVWLPQDRTIIKTNNIPWCECLERIGVPDWHPRGDQIKRAFETGDVSGLDAHDFRKLIVERCVCVLILLTPSLKFFHFWKREWVIIYQ